MYINTGRIYIFKKIINDYEIVLPGFRVSVPRKKGPLRPEISHKNSDHIRLGNIEMVRQGQ